MKSGKLLLGIACLAAACGTAFAQTPTAVRPEQKDIARDPAADPTRQQPGRQGVAAPMNMRIRGDGLALPPGVGRDADDQREEQRETKPAGEAAKKPQR